MRAAITVATASKVTVGKRHAVEGTLLAWIRPSLSHARHRCVTNRKYEICHTEATFTGSNPARQPRGYRVCVLWNSRPNGLRYPPKRDRIETGCHQMATTRRGDVETKSSTPLPKFSATSGRRQACPNHPQGDLGSYLFQVKFVRTSKPRTGSPQLRRCVPRTVSASIARAGLEDF